MSKEIIEPDAEEIKKSYSIFDQPAFIYREHISILKKENWQLRLTINALELKIQKLEINQTELLRKIFDLTKHQKGL